MTKNQSVSARPSSLLTQSAGSSHAAKGRVGNTSIKRTHELSCGLTFNKLISSRQRLPNDFELMPVIVSQQPVNWSSQVSGSENRIEMLMTASQNSLPYS
jgi:hypothetical protein